MKEIQLSKNGKKNKGMYVALVDDDVFPIVNQYNWNYSVYGYARRTDHSTSKQKTIYLHKYIWELKKGKIPEGMLIDHKDRNGLNNQLDNLRLVTYTENNRNISKKKNNKSGFIGVSKKVDKNECQDGIHIHKRWYCTWHDKEGIQRAKIFPFDNIGKVRAARYYDLMTRQSAGNYTGELNFNSLEEYQRALKKAILEDIKSN